MSAAPGLPEPLPADEAVLWQGRPDWRVLARHSFHVRKLALYFLLLAAILAGTNLQAAGRGLLVGAFPVLLVALYAWAVARSSVYTITSKRLVLRIGVALPITINLPFACITSADVLARGDGSGDIAIQTGTATQLGYAVLWPHARPWRLARVQPTLRGLGEVALPAQVLARALAATAGQAVPARAPLAAARPLAAAVPA